MARQPLRLSRPIYEGLPWIYVACGLAALIGSYRSTSRPVSLLIGVAGLLAVLAGVVLLLRRRDYRELRSQYGNPDSMREPGQD
ncbi:MAG TPA: hypothetical protein VFB37_09585 [Steroidobacteraceae bacterium]|nr:hypothetical protein [Steroidobacteraceae bacterium]